MNGKITARDLLLLLLLAAASLAVHGYHIGQQDGAIYLPAIKKNLHPELYAYDAAFFLSQTRWMLSDELVAWSVRATHVPLDVAVFLWHALAIFLVLLASLQLARRCFSQTAAQWAAVSTIAAARLLPVAVTGLHLMDRYLHPRDLATTCILFAFVGVLDRRWTALVWIAAAALLHPTIAIFGAFHLAIQFGWGPKWDPRSKYRLVFPFIFFLAIGGTIGALLLSRSVNQPWRELLATRPYLFPLRWRSHEWLGVVAPLLLLIWFGRLTKSRATEASAARVAPIVGPICHRAVAGALLGVAGAIAITTIPFYEGLIPTEPMRTLQFVYYVFLFVGGGMLGNWVLQRRPARWLMFFAPVCVVFFLSNRLVYRASPHIEWPGRVPENAWVEAFDWIRRNTPPDARFALDPRYMLRPGEDAHGFRAFAERSALADWVKDRAASALDPKLAPRWWQEVRDEGLRDPSLEHDRWSRFDTEDFHRLKERYGVTWVVLQQLSAPVAAAPAPSSRHTPPLLSCPYSNRAVRVCRIE